MNPSTYRTIGISYVNEYYGTTSTTWFAERFVTTRFLFGIFTYSRWVKLMSYDRDGGQSPNTYSTEAEAWDACKFHAAAEAHGVQKQIGRVGDPSSNVSVSALSNLGTNL